VSCPIVEKSNTARLKYDTEYVTACNMCRVLTVSCPFRTVSFVWHCFEDTTNSPVPVSTVPHKHRVLFEKVDPHGPTLAKQLNIFLPFLAHVGRVLERLMVIWRLLPVEIEISNYGKKILSIIHSIWRLIRFRWIFSSVV
jgi:hypothetical protein